MQKIRMKQQRIGFRHGPILNAMNAYGLPWRKTYYRFIIEIILRFPIVDSTSYCLFQEQRVKSECHFMRRLVFRTVEMHNSHQRMLRLETEETVILLYSVCFYYFHISNF